MQPIERILDKYIERLEDVYDTQSTDVIKVDAETFQGTLDILYMLKNALKTFICVRLVQDEQIWVADKDEIEKIVKEDIATEFAKVFKNDGSIEWRTKRDNQIQATRIEGRITILDPNEFNHD